MTSGFICIHQGEDGTVCGRTLRGKGHDDGWIDVSHPAVPGRKCPTCGGAGKMLGSNFDGDPFVPCPACAASPVRGYQAL